MKGRRTVLQLIASTGIGGAEKVLLDICRSLSSNDLTFEVALFAKEITKGWQFLEQALENVGTPVHKIWMRFPGYFNEIGQLDRLFRQIRPDVLHCHGFRADVMGLVATSGSSIRRVSTVHGWVDLGIKMKFYNSLDRLALRRFDAVMPVSERLLQQLRSSGLSPRQVRLLRNVPPVIQVKPRDSSLGQSNRFQVGFLGRFSQEKAVRNLLKAVALVVRTGPVFLHLAGDGPERLQLEGYAMELGLKECTRFYGMVDDPGEFYARLDLFVLPSLTEGTPLVLLEAMAAGVPVIATRVGGVPEVIESDRTGLLVEPGNIEGLASAIRDLRDDAGKRARLAAEGLIRVSSLCDRSQWASALREVYFGGMSAETGA